MGTHLFHRPLTHDLDRKERRASRKAWGAKAPSRCGAPSLAAPGSTPSSGTPSSAPRRPSRSGSAPRPSWTAPGNQIGWLPCGFKGAKATGTQPDWLASLLKAQVSFHPSPVQATTIVPFEGLRGWWPCEHKPVLYCLNCRIEPGSQCAMCFFFIYVTCFFLRSVRRLWRVGEGLPSFAVLLAVCNWLYPWLLGQLCSLYSKGHRRIGSLRPSQEVCWSFSAGPSLKQNWGDDDI